MSVSREQVRITTFRPPVWKHTEPSYGKPSDWPGADGSESHRTNAAPTESILDTVAHSESLHMLMEAVHAAGMEETLSGNGPYTIFAPVDDAFAQLPHSTLRRLLKNRKALTSVLAYHVLPGRLTAAEAAALCTARTVQGQPITVAAENGRVMVDHARILQADIPCANGFIHVIDHVVAPSF